jgi:hypothetical protein
MSKLCECGCGQLAPLAKHAGKGYRKGEPQRYVAGHHPHGFKPGHTQTRPMREGGYKEYHRPDSEEIKAHRLRAEKALGRPLPKGVEVHHADGSKSEHAPLVICPDRAYHMLLHRRMTIVRAGGNPNTDRWCSTCRQAKHAQWFNPSTMGRCRACERERNFARRREGAKPRGRIRSDCGPVDEGLDLG